MTTLEICLRHLTVCQNCLLSRMLQTCTGSLRNENSFCLLLTWPVTQVLYTQCVIRIQGKITASLPPMQSEKRVNSRSHSAPGYDQHLGTLATGTQQAINQSTEYRTFSLLFKVNSADSVVSLDFLHLYLQDYFILPLIHSFIHTQK